MTIQEESTNELMQKRDKFVTEKAELQLRIGKINRECSVRIPNYLYMKLQQERLALNRQVQNCEQWILEINSKQRIKRRGEKIMAEQKKPDNQISLQKLIPQIYEKWLNAPETNFNKLDLLNDLKEIGLLARKLGL